MNSFMSRVGRRIARFFVAGALAILPIVVTVAVVIWVVDFLQKFLGPDTFLGRQLTELGLTVQRNSATAYLFGWIVVLAVVFALGVVVDLGAKKFLQALIEGIFKRIPLVGSIYSTSKQVVDMIDQKDNEAMKGMSPVFCFFGQQATSGVLALLVSPQVYRVGDKDYVIVIIPTAPVPFGGAMVLVESDCVRAADMPVDGLMSIYLSMGATAPQFMAVEGPAEGEVEGDLKEQG